MGLRKDSRYSSIISLNIIRRFRHAVIAILITLSLVQGFHPGPTYTVIYCGARKRRIIFSTNRSTLLVSKNAEDGGENVTRSDSTSSLRKGIKPMGPTLFNNKIHNVTVVPSTRESEMIHRITQLEYLAAYQAVEIKRLKKQCADLAKAAEVFGNIVDLLRQAGLKTSGDDEDDVDEDEEGNISLSSSTEGKTIIESYEDPSIFGKAPADVMEAADAAGTSILAGILGGKQRMLVDVRDADLSRDPETLVQFIELAILPVAAGIEGLKSKRNRLKIVFPTVSQLMLYRKTMTLAAPEVVALSTLGFDPVEDRDNLVVIIAPSPDDDEGWEAMNSLLTVDNSSNSSGSITQPVVVMNHHMIPVSGPAARFEVAYHLRLLSVQYMAGETSQEFLTQLKDAEQPSVSMNLPNATVTNSTIEEKELADEEAFEAAMEHAHRLGVHHGVTRAMIVRAYPQPWHVFVDTSPSTDADFEVAAIFDKEPTQDQVNMAIVECLEGSEEEDELVAKQMQEAFESGQLNRVSELLGRMNLEALTKEDDDEGGEGDDFWDFFKEDSV